MDVITTLIVKLRIKRLMCTKCHKTFASHTPVFPRQSKLSFHTIYKIMHLLKQPNETFASVGNIVGIPESTVIRIFDRYCSSSPVIFPSVICIDEFYTKNNDYHSKYACIFYDFLNRKIIDILPDRKKTYLMQYLSKIDSRILDTVEYISIDMYKPYLDISKHFFRHAKVAVDAFHVIQQLQQCIYGIRNRILKHYLPNTHEYYLLKQWHSLLIERNEFLFTLPGKYNKRFKMILNRQQLLDKLLNIHTDLRGAYTVYHLYMDFNQYNY
ncbi:ISL3 family transposase [Granulicatella sp. 19428wC4_WM01]|nr:ISL3 family transposase [Granulicatella sp. 19428wC4_WM01]